MPIPQLSNKKTKRYEPPSHRKLKRKKLKKARLSSDFKKQANIQKKVSLRQQKNFKYYLKKIFWAGSVFLALGIIFTIGIFAWVSRELPDPDRISEIVPINSIRFYDRTGETLLFEKGDVIQQPVEWDKVPANLKYATLVLEDKNFYEHHGFSFIGVARALWHNLTGQTGYTSGGSTLTQQLIKNTIVGSEKTYLRKAKELILALQIERKFSKEQILELYFNRVYYGRFHMGVASASRDFFDKNIEELSLNECATLASIPRNPPYYLNNPDKLKARRDYALDGMVEEGYITPEEAAAAKNEAVPTITESTTNILAPHFVFYVNDLLTEKYGSSFIQHKGLKVITTLDLYKQEKAEEAVQNGLSKIEQYGGSNAGLVSIDTHTGQIVAMVGSKDFFAEDYDGQVNVANSLRQPGSSFKPIVYLTAFAKGYPPTTNLYDLETDFPTETGNYHPRNYDLGQRGPVSMRYALGQSLNIPAVKTLYLAGIDNVLTTAESLGYTSLSDRSRFGLALVLGGGEVTLVEHTAAFATFAREGERHPLTAVLRVEDQNGKVLEEWQDNAEQVYDEKAVRQLNDVLSDKNARAGFTALNLADRPSAAKTGTTNDYRDAWTIGYTPSLATGVWAGNNDNSAMLRGAAGLVIAAPIWQEYMNNVLAGTPVEEFQKPENNIAKKPVLNGSPGEKVTKKIDSLTKKIIPEECLDNYDKSFIEEKEFIQAHSILYYLDKDDPTGDYPTNPEKDPQFNAWEAAVQRFAESNADYLPSDEEKIEYENCALRSKEKQPKVNITSPKAGDKTTKKNLVLQAKIAPAKNRSVIKVEFIIDHSVIVDTQEYTASETTIFTSSYSPTNLTAGEHTLTIIAYDNKGSKGQATIAFSYLGKQNNKN